MNRLAFPVATVFGCGYSPIAPGTVGSAAALLCAILWQRQAPMRALFFGLLAIALLPLAIWAADCVASSAGKKDPGLVVVDEWIGQWITLGGATNLNWKSWLAAFALFRLFDMWKPAPARQLEALPGGAGIVADDAMAGLYGALVLYLAGCCNLY